MFKKILIANRGEIACRIIDSAKKVGVETVAIYSDVDADSKHVAMADEAWYVGPAQASESYLQGGKIIEIALKSGAEAIHPGYGFLSESPDFVEKVEKSGLRFIGPSSDAIRKMGLKDAAKVAMVNAGVSVVPGYHGSNQSLDFLLEEADKIGYPVLIKARAGGGGKGMRKVDRAADFPAALKGAQREGKASFGDAHCLIEKWITSPRHIEIQVFGDDYGNVVHLFERDCSLQRRHQKVIEEAPAPGMTEEMRSAMGSAAVLCAKSIGYSGAGTVEFIVDASEGLKPDRFWFMEMNTRLQVEHPVTEFITGVDLVEWQLRVASGEHLPATQDSLALNGHSFEARIYAEDVPAGFLPVSGKIDYLSMPEGVRVDSGVREGDVITSWYDPLISKLIVHGPNREVALNTLRKKLLDSKIGGTTTNLSFLAALCADEKFASGDVDTNLIDDNIDRLIIANEVSSIDWATAAILMHGTTSGLPLDGWNMWSPLKRTMNLAIGNDTREVVISQTGLNGFDLKLPDEELSLRVSNCSSHQMDIEIDGAKKKVLFSKQENEVTIFSDYTQHIFHYIQPDSSQNIGDEQEARVVSPMPGVVKVVARSVGEHVKIGDLLVIVEAMKMEHSVCASTDGVVKEVFVTESQQVESGAVLVELDDEDE